MFTRQLVIQGRSQLLGNEEETLLKSISEAPRFPSPAFKATFQRPTSETLQVSLTGTLRMKVDRNGMDIDYKNELSLFLHCLYQADPDGRRIEINCATCGRNLAHVFKGEAFAEVHICIAFLVNL